RLVSQRTEGGARPIRSSFLDRCGPRPRNAGLTGSVSRRAIPPVLARARAHALARPGAPRAVVARRCGRRQPQRGPVDYREDAPARSPSLLPMVTRGLGGIRAFQTGIGCETLTGVHLGCVDDSPRESRFRAFACAVAAAVGTHWAFVIALGVVLAWALTGPVFHFSDSWQLVINTGTTIVTFLMVFLIQATQNRDGKAIQLKLDELIRSQRSARNVFADLEHAT